jgi:hypothetical protein
MAENKLYNFNLPSPYQSELSRIADQQRMAQMLQAQSQQPTERFSYKGIEARTPATAGLAKLLQGFGGAYLQGQAREEEKALGERYRRESMDDMMRYAEMAGRPAVAAVQGQDAFTPTVADYEDRAMGGAPDFNVNEQGMVPAVAPVAARMRGQIDPSMIGQFTTPEMQRMALASMLKQGELPAAFNLGAEETRFQPQVGGGAPVAVARGMPKPLPSPFAQINLEKFTPASVQAAMNADGTVDRTKLVAIPERATGDLAVYNLYVEQQKAAGKVPMGIDQFIINQKIAGRTPAAQRDRSVYDADRGGVVNVDTGVFTPATQGGKPLSPKSKPLTESQSKAAVFESQMRGATDELALIPGYNPESGFSQAETAVAGGRGNMLISENAQRAKQAQSQWAESFLRFKTGAASTPAEVASNIATFFPQLGDKPETIAQKKRMRARAENDIAFASGNALSQKQGKQPGQTDPSDPLGLRR